MKFRFKADRTNEILQQSHKSRSEEERNSQTIKMMIKNDIYIAIYKMYIDKRKFVPKNNGQKKIKKYDIYQ